VISACCAACPILPELQRKAGDVNRRLLDHERVGQGGVLASPAFERIARPSPVDGRRAPALRFGDPRVQALAGALAATVYLIGGFAIFYTKVHNRLLRPMLARISRPRGCQSGRPSGPSAKPSTTTSTKPA
jgi:hypothetical protein